MTIATSSNAAVLFLDLQEEIVKNSRTVGVEQLKRTSAVLAKLASLHKLPAYLSAVPPGGAFLESVTSVVPDSAPRNRLQTSAFADEGLVDALKVSGRSLLVLAGVASEIVVQRTALDALAAGYAVQIAVDACGGVGERTEQAAWARIEAAGGVRTSVLTFAAELAGDFTAPAGGATLGLMYEAMGG